MTCGSTSPSPPSPPSCARPRPPGENPWTTFANVEKSWAYRQDQLPSTHPVAADIPDIAAVEVNFDGITYAKGASVLSSNSSPTWVRSRSWPDCATTSTPTSSETPLSRIFLGTGTFVWTRSVGLGQSVAATTGINVIRPDFDVDAEGRSRVSPSCRGGAEGAQPGGVDPRAPAAGGIYDDNGSGKLEQTHSVELDVEGATTEVPGLVGISRGALVLLNDGDLTYAPVRLDPESLATATTGRRHRGLDAAHADLVGGVGDDPPGRDEGSRLRGAGVGGYRRRIGNRCGAAGSAAKPPPPRLVRRSSWADATGWPEFSARVLELAQASDAGSDHQLAFVNTLLAGRLNDDQIPLVRGLLDGDDPGTHGLPS